MLHWESSRWWRYGVAVAAALLAVGLRAALDPWFGSEVPFITLFVAIAFVVWWVGTGPAVFTAAVGAVLCAWLFMPGRLLSFDSRSILVFLVYVVAGLMIIALGDYARRRDRDATRSMRKLIDRDVQLQLIVDALPILISYIDRELKYRFNNRAYQRWFGLEPGALHGRTVREIIGPAAFAVLESQMQRALAGEAVQFESALDYGDAGTRQVSVTYVPHRIGDLVRGFFALVEDVTDRRVAERARAHLAAIFDSAGDAVVSKDLEGRVLSWNAGAERLFGYSAEEMIGTPILRLIPPELVGEEDMILHQVRAGTTVQHLETERLTRDGERVPVSVTVSPIRDAQGRVLGASKIARNITKRRDAMRALQQSEARFRALADNAPMLIWRADVDNRGVWFNRYWLEFTGHRMEQELGFGWGDCIHPDDRERVIGFCATHFERREPFEMEFRMHRHDGVYRWMLDRGAPVFDGPNGEFTGYIGSSIDITERKQAIEQLAQAHQRKDEFLATLAHELRNPLAPILNAAQFLHRRPGGDASTSSAIEIVERQARHMTRLVDDLLDVSRISRGKIALRRQVLRLNLALDAAIEAIRPGIEGAGHTLRTELQPDVYVDGDLTRLSQVFGNLISNAVKYTPPGGVIAIRMEADDSAAVVRVSDTGIGLPEDALERVFEMFAQIPSEQVGTQDGLGIGLHLARQLVTLHDGEIRAQSPGKGQGTEFIVRLPRVSQTAAVGPAPAHEPAAENRGTRLRVLLVDDSADVRRSVAMMLEMEGHEVQLAHDGVEAIEAFARQLPDLVLMDIGMPRMDGYEAARRIRALPGGREVRLVALTGWGQEEDRRLAMEAGFDEHWTKPIEFESLRQVVDAARRRSQAEAAAPASPSRAPV